MEKVGLLGSGGSASNKANDIITAELSRIAGRQGLDGWLPIHCILNDPDLDLDLDLVLDLDVF